MPIENLLSLTFVFIAAMAVYGFRRSLLEKLRRFNEANRARRAEEIAAVFDKYAHYRQTLSVAEEQIEQVTKIVAADSRTGTPVERFLFLGIEYPTLAEAEIARHAEIVAKAREFYIDLDKAALERRRAAETLRR
jgi:hypothetical protein